MIDFDVFRLDPAILHIFRDGHRLDAPPQVVEVLAYLISHADRTVTRQELLERFWARSGTGGDAALNTCIRRIRTLLEDDSETPRFIQTRPRIGYRFIGSLATEEEEEAAAVAVAETEVPRTRRRLILAGGTFAALAIGGVGTYGMFFRPHHRLAIGPADGLCEYTLFPKFNAGLRESFVAEVSRRLPENCEMVASNAKVDLRVKTSVRQTPQRTVVTVSLVHEDDGRNLWTGEYADATDTDDYVPLQRSLARRMASGLAEALRTRT
jgi:DNA-binding winged helix-turn-helix (wHTH) protein